MGIYSEIKMPAGWEGWELTEEIGSGSFGTVYKAIDKESGTVSAIKILEIPRGGIITPAIMDEISGAGPEAGSEDKAKSKKDRLKERSQGQAAEPENPGLPQGLKGAELLKEIRRREEAEAEKERAQREAVRDYYRKIAAGCLDKIREMDKLRDNKHILTVHEAELLEDEEAVGSFIFIRTDCLQSAKDKLVAGELAEMEVAALGADLCDALQAAEKEGIVHGDIKPENILINEDGDYVLCDFGLNSLLKNTVMSLGTSGTFRYTAPEAHQNDIRNHSTDLYAVGILLYTLMNKDKDPFVDMKKPVLYFQDRDKAFRKRLEGTEPVPAPVEGSEAFKNIILRACAYEPKKRYRNARQFKDDLEKLKTGSYTVRRINTKKSGSGKGKKKYLKRAACLVLLCGLILGGRWTWNHFFNLPVDKENCGPGVTCTLDGNGVLRLEGEGSPSVGGYPWTKYKDRIRKVLIPDGITAVTDGMFTGCEKLRRVKLGQDISLIGKGAFEGCTSLRKLELPDSVDCIMPHAFSGTPWMEEKDSPFLIRDKVLYYYEGKDQDKELEIPEDITCLADYSLAENESLVTLNLPDSLDTISEMALEGSTNLEYFKYSSGSPITKAYLKTVAPDTAWYRLNYSDEARIRNLYSLLKTFYDNGHKKQLMTYYSRQLDRILSGDKEVTDGLRFEEWKETSLQSPEDSGEKDLYIYDDMVFFKEYGEWVFADKESFMKYREEIIHGS